MEWAEPNGRDGCCGGWRGSRLLSTWKYSDRGDEGPQRFMYRRILSQPEDTRIHIESSRGESHRSSCSGLQPG